jgi:aspartate racemase
MKTIGILGGMGPKATQLFYKKIIEATPADKDQDHIPTLIYSNSQIPDRGTAISNGQAASVLDELIRSAKVLEHAGVDIIAIPCNTAHFFYDDLQAAINIPILHIIEETAKAAAKMSETNFGLLATTTTANTKLYHNVFDKHGLSIHTPSESDQTLVLDAINAVKAGKPIKPLQEALAPVIKKLQDNGCKTSILGCTEIPLIFQDSPEISTLDPLDVLAQTAINFALSK